MNSVNRNNLLEKGVSFKLSDQQSNLLNDYIEIIDKSRRKKIVKELEQAYGTDKINIYLPKKNKLSDMYKIMIKDKNDVWVSQDMQNNKWSWNNKDNKWIMETNTDTEKEGDTETDEETDTPPVDMKEIMNLINYLHKNLRIVQNSIMELQTIKIKDIIEIFTQRILTELKCDINTCEELLEDNITDNMIKVCLKKEDELKEFISINKEKIIELFNSFEKDIKHKKKYEKDDYVKDIRNNRKATIKEIINSETFKIKYHDGMLEEVEIELNNLEPIKKDSQFFDNYTPGKKRLDNSGGGDCFFLAISGNLKHQSLLQNIFENKTIDEIALELRKNLSKLYRNKINNIKNPDSVDGKKENKLLESFLYVGRNENIGNEGVWADTFHAKGIIEVIDQLYLEGNNINCICVRIYFEGYTEDTESKENIVDTQCYDTKNKIFVERADKICSFNSENVINIDLINQGRQLSHSSEILKGNHFITLIH
jgi:hypothetical protein